MTGFDMLSVFSLNGKSTKTVYYNSVIINISFFIAGSARNLLRIS